MKQKPSVRKIDCQKGTVELLEIIKNNPGLPIVILTDYEVVADGCGFWFGQTVTYSIKELIEYKDGYGEIRYLDDKDDLRERLFDDL